MVYNLATFYLQRVLLEADYVAVNEYEYVIKQIAKGNTKLPKNLIIELKEP
jgi:hypothetical protein